MSEKKKCGFAAMDEDKRREIASKGGKAAHKSGRAHRFTKEEASDGGKVVSQNREYMAVIGRKGGKNSPKKEAS